MEGSEPTPEGHSSIMTSSIITPHRPGIHGLEHVLLTGDLGRLGADERVAYYARVCESVGLNPLTQPFEYLSLNGRTVLYARRACTDQLRHIHHVSIQIVSRESIEGCYIVTARATMPSGRCDESIGAVPVSNLKGEALANAVMKAETKAKRRVTLALCGLSMLDESELEGVPQARSAPQRAPEAFPLAQQPAVPAPQAPQAPAWEPSDTEERSGVVVPFKAPQAPATALERLLAGSVAARPLVARLGGMKTAEELVGWMREVRTLDLSREAKQGLWAEFSRRAHSLRLDPDVLLAKAKGGA